MRYYIYHWYRGNLDAPVPEAFKDDMNYNGKMLQEWVVDVPDIHEFVKVHGPVILRPPEINFPHWTIIVTDKSGRFLTK